MNKMTSQTRRSQRNKIKLRDPNFAYDESPVSSVADHAGMLDESISISRLLDSPVSSVQDNSKAAQSLELLTPTQLKTKSINGHGVGDTSRNNKSLLFEGITETVSSVLVLSPSPTCTPIETKLARTSKLQLQANCRIDELLKDNHKMRDAIIEHTLKLQLRDKQIEALTLEVSDLKITNMNQKRQLSRQIDELDSLTQRIVALDEKNAEQRMHLRQQKENKDQIQDLETICKGLEDRLHEKSQKLEDALFELNIVTARFESLQMGTTNRPTLNMPRDQPSSSTAVHPTPAPCTRPVPAPRQRNKINRPQYKQPDPSIFVIGNSNVKGLASRLNAKGVDATAAVHSSAKISTITNSLNKGAQQDHEFVVVHAMDIDIRTQSPMSTIKSDVDQLIHTAKQAFPRAKICISSAPLGEHPRINERAKELNEYLRRHCIHDMSLLFISNDSLDLWRDGIHLTNRSKDLLANSIIHVTSLVKKNGL